MKENRKPPLIIISGPTAAGKSALGVKLAADIGGEIISADSMQVYKYMDIGTAKIKEEEKCGIIHHMIDVCSPLDSFTVADFKLKAEECIDKIYENGHMPIIVGGTGFYIHALLYDSSFEPEEDSIAITEKYRRFYEEEGADALYALLTERDPEYCQCAHRNNIKRVIRALSFLELTGIKMSEHNFLMQQKTSPYDFLYFGIIMDRKKLYERIDERIDLMIENGLVSEVKSLKYMGLKRSDVSMQGLGYKEIMSYIDGEMSLEEAVLKVKQGTKKYAKRQIVWLKREKDVEYINAPVSDEEYGCILKKCMKLSE